MKKLISTILCAAFLAAPVIPAMAEEQTVSVIVDNERVEFDQPPVIEEGRTLVPLRAVFEKAGAAVDWNQETLTATIQRGDYTVQVTLDQQVLYKNGEEIALDVPAKMINDRTLIPVRAIGEAMDFAVAWDGFHSQVVVSTSGKQMRPYAARRWGFSPLADAAEFYSEESFTWQNMDLDGDGSMDTASFTVSKDTASEQTPLLIINGENLSELIKFLPSTDSFALVDIDKSDKTKEIVISSNSDKRTAYFFRYAGNTLTPIMKGEDRATITYLKHLFLDQKSYILSDLEGITWTDIMLTGSAYQLENNIMTQYYVSNAANMIPRMLVHSYGDEMVYNVYDVNEFKKGTYKGKEPDRLAKAAELEKFTVQDMYIDNVNPEYVEFFITIPDGPNMVISPYRP